MESFEQIREGVRALCRKFDSAYWRRMDEERGYPDEFVRALTEAGWLAALIPQDFGGGGLGLAEASVILEEINRSGGNSGACHVSSTTWGPCCGTAPRRKSATTFRRSRAASCA